MAHKTSAMVEAGILAAIAIVFALISTYVPVLGILVNFIWSLPIILCGMRNGLRWSIMTLVVSGTAISILISPLNALLLVPVFGLLGLVLGECMRRKMPPMKLMMIGSVAAFISLMISVTITFFVMGIDPISLFFQTFDQALLDITDFYRQQGLSEEQIAAAIKSAQDSFKLTRLVLPGSFILCAPLITFVNYLAARAVLSKLGGHFEKFPPFINLHLPRWIIVPYAISLFILYQFDGQTENILYLIGVNAQLVCSILLVLQGIAVIFWYIKNKNLPKWWGKLAIVLIFLSQFVSQYVVLVGAFDLFFDFRKLREGLSK